MKITRIELIKSLGKIDGQIHQCKDKDTLKLFEDYRKIILSMLETI